ncbi:10561_t:CDS:2 [Diversispora eburnea]|uniref:10561_t:CDS:1 n=1 Tax=Diversispora eburnea TaxID=1213867 RepID=A0A9N9AGP9_9GLOM|nr:10561_t:CDS:2 [Diversispora eburnea]
MRPSSIFLSLTTTSTVAYDRKSASSYATAHCKEHNPNYPAFPSDCTNFASQVLSAGGIPQTEEWHCRNPCIKKLCYGDYDVTTGFFHHTVVVAESHPTNPKVVYHTSDRCDGKHSFFKKEKYRALCSCPKNPEDASTCAFPFTLYDPAIRKARMRSINVIWE